MSTLSTAGCVRPGVSTVAGCPGMTRIREQGFALRKVFKKCIAGTGNAKKLFVTAAGIWMKLLGESSKGPFDLDWFKLSLQRQIECLPVLPPVDGPPGAALICIAASGVACKLFFRTLPGGTPSFQGLPSQFFLIVPPFLP